MSSTDASQGLSREDMERMDREVALALQQSYDDVSLRRVLCANLFLFFFNFSLVFQKSNKLFTFLS